MNKGYFRFWCQKVLPLVYDDSLSYYELLCKIINYINNLIDDITSISKEITEIYNELNTLKTYLENLDLSEYVNDKLDKMAEEGYLDGLIQAVTSPLSYNAYNDILLKNPVTIMCVGDSITYGYDPTPENVGKQVEYTYPKVMQNTFNAFGYNNVNVVNEGVTSETSTMLLNKLDALIEKNNPKIIIWSYGATEFRTSNIDCLFDITIKNLITTYNICKKKGILLLVWSPLPLNYGNYVISQLTRPLYAMIYKNVCNQLGIPFVDMFHEFLNLWNTNAMNPTAYLIDGAHMTSYVWIANILLKNFFPIVMDYIQHTTQRPLLRGAMGTLIENYTAIKVSVNGRERQISQLNPNTNYLYFFYSDVPFKIYWLTVLATDGGTATFQIQNPIETVTVNVDTYHESSEYKYGIVRDNHVYGAGRNIIRLMSVTQGNNPTNVFNAKIVGPIIVQTDDIYGFDINGDS